MESLDPVVEVEPFEVWIGDDIKITTDKLNVIVNQRYDKQDKDGNLIGDGFKILGFYPNLEKALVALLHKQILVSHVNSVEELLSVIRYSTNEIVKAVKNNSL
jgi:hypothetical protein